VLIPTASTRRGHDAAARCAGANAFLTDAGRHADLIALAMAYIAATSRDERPGPASLFNLTEHQVR
jgi:hypothetical protein